MLYPDIAKASVALEVMRTRDGRRLQQLFVWIYSSYYASFLSWILRLYSTTPYKDKLLEDAKDAFQNGMLALLLKSQTKDLILRGSLKTAVYSFAFHQLLAIFKREKNIYRNLDDADCLSRFVEDERIELERNALLNQRDKDLLNALARLPKKRHDILVMKFFDKLKSKQIAEKLHVTVGNVDNDSTRAYKELRIALQSKFSFQGA